MCSADPTSGNYIHLHDIEINDFMIVEPMTYHEIVSLAGIKAFMTHLAITPVLQNTRKIQVS